MGDCPQRGHENFLTPYPLLPILLTRFCKVMVRADNTILMFLITPHIATAILIMASAKGGESKPISTGRALPGLIVP
ncbi:hypothetical protein NUACC26_047780 [Scytonema sp. NUACC26]